MLDMAITLAMENAGLGKYGETLWFGTSPVLSDGSVSASSGVWVNLSAGGTSRGCKTATITVSTRADDVVYQGLLDAHIHDWVDNVLPSLCVLSCRPILDFEYEIVTVTSSQAETLEAVDAEGRWVKSIAFDVAYKQPERLPSLESYTPIY